MTVAVSQPIQQGQGAMQTPVKKQWAQPSHPSAIRVISSGLLTSSTDEKAASFCLAAVADRDIPANTLIVKNTSTTLAAIKAYSTVQVSKDQHIELNSDLLYCNHSCDPNVRFVTSTLAMDSHNGQADAPVSGALEVWSVRDISAGEELRFFYPSTEWEMSQPFQCSCGAKQCLEWVDGAKKTPTDVLRKYWLSDHIRELLDERND
ncbi:hypothetical protein FQN49_003809 [Arthroderma sp. PD_2]|nr:hypothetical protein FQN49_003809 [Arthroderma sp. PD_2]